MKTRLEEALEVEARAAKEAEEEGDSYKIPSAEKIIKFSCPGDFNDNSISKHPFNLSVKECNKEPTDENCRACWNEPYEEERS